MAGFKKIKIRGGKAQAAVEFMTTYGWAMLIVVVAVGALVFFGFSDPSRLAPSSCDFDSSVRCTQYSVSATEGVSFKLANNVGKQIILTAYNCAYEDGTSMSASVEEKLAQNAEVELQCVGENPMVAGRKHKIAIEVSYKLSDDGLIHVSQGTIVANVRD